VAFLKATPVVASADDTLHFPWDLGRCGWAVRNGSGQYPGCGQSPTPRCTTHDNSPAILIGHRGWPTGLEGPGPAHAGNLSYIDYCRAHIKYARRRLKHILWRWLGVGHLSSHMLEHLDRTRGSAFVKEGHRALMAGGN